jgi:hypothetical protein
VIEAMFLMPYIRPITDSGSGDWVPWFIGVAVAVVLVAAVLFAFSYRPAKQPKATAAPGRLQPVS